MTSSHDRDWACAVLRWTQTVLQDPRMLATARHDRIDDNSTTSLYSDACVLGTLRYLYLVLVLGTCTCGSAWGYRVSGVREIRMGCARLLQLWINRMG